MVRILTKRGRGTSTQCNYIWLKNESIKKDNYRRTIHFCFQDIFVRPDLLVLASCALFVRCLSLTFVHLFFVLTQVEESSCKGSFKYYVITYRGRGIQPKYYN